MDLRPILRYTVFSMDNNNSFKIVQGNLFDSDARYICHQCNCVTTIGAHLAASMFKRFPYADIYAERNHSVPKDETTLGNIVIRGDGESKRFVVNLLGQYYPGKSRFSAGIRDGHITREEAFQSCLEKISQIENLHSVAFPWMIGCGAAGGDWQHYQQLLMNFADNVSAKTFVFQLKGI